MAEQHWTGQLDLTIFNNGESSKARNIFFEKALKVLRPIYLEQSPVPTFYIVNVGGGYLDGDRYRLNVNLEDNAQVTLTSQGATKIYKTPNDHVEQYQTFNLSNQSYMEFVADPIIAYENAKFFQHNTFNLKEDSAIFYTDILTPGYSSNGQDFTYNYIGYMENYTHLGSAYFIHPDVNQSFIDDIYVAVADFQKQYDCRIGISQLPTHGLAVRILTKRTQIIEEILTRVQSYINQTIYHRQINFLRKY